MAFPHPPSYYGLQLSESAENLITSLDYSATFHLTYDLVFFMSTDSVDRFYSMSIRLVKWFEDEIDGLSKANKISLLRWLGDRLAFLHTVPVQEVK